MGERTHYNELGSLFLPSQGLHSLETRGGRCSRAAGLGQELEQIHLCADILGSKEMTPLSIPVPHTAAGSLPQPAACLAEPHPHSPHHTLTALDRHTGISAQCQLQVQPPGNLFCRSWKFRPSWCHGMGRERLTCSKPLAGPCRAGLGAMAEGSSLLWASLGAKAWAETSCGRKVTSL